MSLTISSQGVRLCAYIARNTRPDLLSQGKNKPDKEHLKDAKPILRYLCHTRK